MFLTTFLIKVPKLITKYDVLFPFIDLSDNCTQCLGNWLVHGCENNKTPVYYSPVTGQCFNLRIVYSERVVTLSCCKRVSFMYVA